MIGLMVGLLLAGLLGWYFLSRRTGGNIIPATAQPIMSNNGPNPASAPPGSVINGISYGPDGLPLTTDAQGVQYKGTTFITKQSSAGQLAAKSGATGYDPNNPQVAVNTINAIYVATQADAYLKANTDAYNKANGTNWTTDQFAAFQKSVKDQQIAASAFAASQVASQSGASSDPGPSPGPGYYWSYIYNAWTPLPPNTVTAPTTETRTGRGHF